MDLVNLHCLSVLLLLLTSGASAAITKRSQIYDTYPAMVMHQASFPPTIMHDTYPTDVPPDNPAGDVPTFNPTPTTTPTTTPPYTPSPTTNPPNIPTTTPTTPTTNPTPSYGGGGGGGGGAGGIGGGGGGGGGGGWCVANPSASEKALQVGLDYACGYGGADCSAIQSGGSCYDPDTVKDHASYAYNDYYQKNPAPTSCDFGGTAQLVSTDPSSGNCHYASSKGSTSAPPTTPTPTMPTPPTTFSPPSPPLPNFPGPPLGAGTGFGLEPTASPNMATAITLQWFLFTSARILVYILLANDL